MTSISRQVIRIIFTTAAITILATLAMTAKPAYAFDPVVDEERLLQYTNQQRVAAGLPPLKLWLPAIQVARQHSFNMAQSGNFAHSADWERVPQIWQNAAQNIGYTTKPLSGDAAIQRIQCGQRGCNPIPSPVPPCPLSPLSGSDNGTSFLTSKSHCETLMSAIYNYVGIGVVYGADGRMWVTLDFFNISNPNLGFPGTAPVSESPVVSGPGENAVPNNTWYFAEGFTGPGFDTHYTIMNPGENNSEVAVTFYLQGSAATKNLTVAPRSRTTLDARDVVGDDKEIGAKVTSSSPVVAERTMIFRYKGSIDGGSSLIGKTELSTDFYLAEGYTGPGFDTWITVINPGSLDAPLKVTYMKPGGATVVKNTYSVGANRRITINVNNDVPGSDVSTRVESTNGVPILVERPMYFTYSPRNGNGTYKGGHVGAGVTAPGTNFDFAEGYTGPGFDEWITVQNPGTSAATVTLRYLLDDGAPVSETFEIAAQARFTRMVNSRVPNKSLSANVSSNRPVVVERPMYFSYNGWTGGHNAPGATLKYRHAFIPDLDTRAFSDTWLTVANSNGAEAKLTFRFFDEAGQVMVRNGTVPASSRGTFKVNTLAGDGKRLSVVISSDQDIAVEKPLYFWRSDADGGTVALAYGVR